MRRSPSVVLTIIDSKSFHGLVRPYLRLSGTAEVVEGRAPELLLTLAIAVGNPDVSLPPPNAPDGFTTRIAIHAVAGSGP